MNCHEARAGLPHYLNDELSASERELLQTHLAGCEACFAELQTTGALQRQIRAGLHGATERAEPSSQTWVRLHASIQSTRTPQPAQQPRPAFFLRAIGAVFATLSVMVGAAVLRPGLMGNLTPASEATMPAQTQVTQLSQPASQQPAHGPAAATDPDHKQLAAFLKTEPYQSVRTAIAVLSEADSYALNDFTCRTCVRMQ
jgi:anti-sigma factor RsiW